MLNPTLDALSVEVVLALAVQASHILPILEVLPANDALLLTVEHKGAPFELADGSQHEDLQVVVVNLIHFALEELQGHAPEHVDSVHYDEEAKDVEEQHQQVQEVVLELRLLLVLVPWNALVLVRKEEGVIAVHHPPELERFKCAEDDQFREVGVEDLLVDDNQEKADDVVDQLEASEEGVVANPGFDRDAARWLVEHATGQKHHGKDEILEERLVQLLPLDFLVLSHAIVRAKHPLEVGLLVLDGYRLYGIGVLLIGLDSLSVADMRVRSEVRQVRGHATGIVGLA